MTRIFGFVLLPAAALALRPAPLLPLRRVSQPTRSTISKIRAAADCGSLEDAVVISIREGLAAGSQLQAKMFFSALSQFGNASGSLVETWLTPQKLEEACFFWYEGSTALLLRDLRLGRFSWADLRASGWFGLLSLGTFPWTPLLVPLVSRALNNSDEHAFVPRALSGRRIRALKRLQRDSGLAAVAPDLRTPQNIGESARFFADGGRLLLRDLSRGALLSRKDDTLSAYAWFSFLSFSTFPLTPLLLPLIDKRRINGQQSEYVPSSFRAKRLAAFARLRDIQAPPSLSPTDTVRAAGAEGFEEGSSSVRPAPATLLAAIAALQPVVLNEHDQFLDALAGGGTPGRRWQLVYIAGKDAVISARKECKVHGGCAPQASWTDRVEQVLLPWTRLKGGLYVDQLVTAIQRFDLEALENENGIFGLLGAEWLRLTVVGPFKWPSPQKRTVCAFEPHTVRCKLGSLEWEWMFNTEPAETFRTTPLKKLPFFKFLYVDEAVAVAQGRSGSVAVWARLQEPNASVV
mmetsp:Transcript_75374/g.137760  ORF Transcript_75374/g.137760 Transcript_75374/m.137760 type:complete len:519 (+) Transcript_75374:54-1610(+)